MAFLNETGLQKLWEHIDNKFARITEVQSMINNVEAKIPTVPTSLKNPNSLTIKGNGTQSFTYDGSSAKTLNIKPGTNISVSSDTSGNITINATDTNTTYTFATGDNDGQIAVIPLGGTKQNVPVKGFDGISSIAYLANTKANELITGAMAANKATNVVINNGADVIQFITHNSTTNLPAVINGAILIAYDA